MSDRPTAPPEGELITAALKRKKMSAREAARRAGISDARWRQITSGYQTVSGTRVPVSGPPETIARMAQVVGVTPEQLAGAGREDAADALRDLAPPGEPEAEPTIAELSARLATINATLTAEREARLDLERRFEELLAQQDEENKRRGKTS